MVFMASLEFFAVGAILNLRGFYGAAEIMKCENFDYFTARWYYLSFCY